MVKRSKATLGKDGRLVIPPEIRDHRQFHLDRETRIGQCLEQNSILLFRCGESAAQSDTDCLDRRYALRLKKEYLEQLAIPAGEVLYLYTQGDLIAVQKACCERCGREGGSQLVEYEPTHFMCIPCVAYAIHFEKERRR